MHFEMLVILVLLLLLMFIAFELVVLYNKSEKQDKEKNRKEKETAEVLHRYDSIINAPTKSSYQDDISALKQYLDNNFERQQIAYSILIKYRNDDTFRERQRGAVADIYDALNPVEELRKKLDSLDKHEKAFVIRQIADFGEKSEIENIRDYVKHKNFSLAYNAAMALASLGDADSVAEFIIKIGKDQYISHRIILELFSNFSGDREQLAHKIYDDTDDDYLKATVIKAIGKYAYRSFAAEFRKGAKSKLPNMRCACIKALGSFNDAEYERDLILAMKDQEWVVRCCAVNSARGVKTENIFDALVNATGDSEWWVRNNAAKVLVDIDNNLIYVEKVLKSYDKYASDAVKYSIYKTLAFSETAQ